MKIVTPRPQSEYLIKKLYGLVWRLENTGDGDFTKNGELSFLQSLAVDYKSKNFIFFDIGANIGEYTEMVLNNFKNDSVEAHLFEPQKSCFLKLENLFRQKRVRLNNFGLSDSSHTSKLYKDHDQSGLASLYQRDLRYYNLQLSEAENIKLEVASTYISNHAIKKINLIKIDVEGHEIAALTGFGSFLNSDNVDYIQFEYGGANLDSKTSLLDLFNFFTERGFWVCKMMKHSLVKQTYHPRFENFMYQNWVAVSPRVLDSSYSKTSI
jgi:FkbM family methyltransferase